MQQQRRGPGSPQQLLTEKIVGQVVLTRYSNRTYLNSYYCFLLFLLIATKISY